MAQTAAAIVIPEINRHALRNLERHFIAPEIYRRVDAPDRHAKLARFVSKVVVPRLLRLHTDVLPDAPPVDEVIEALAPSADDVSGLAHIVLGPDLEAAIAYVVMLRTRGLSMDTLFVELLEPTARYLGELWERDECDFIDVTLGVGRLQKLLAVFNDTHMLPALETQRQVLMAMTPGNQHSFGVAMVTRFLRAAGWDVETELSATAGEIVAAASRQWFAVIGLTAGSDRQLDTLTALLAELRRRSLNRDVGLMVGGPMFTADPTLASRVGADATAPNAPAAVLVAQKLFDLRASSLGMRSRREVVRLPSG